MKYSIKRQSPKTLDVFFLNHSVSEPSFNSFNLFIPTIGILS